jgi:Oxidoreductase molybdopterin binding domain
MFYGTYTTTTTAPASLAQPSLSHAEKGLPTSGLWPVFTHYDALAQPVDKLPAGLDWSLTCEWRKPPSEVGATPLTESKVFRADEWRRLSLTFLRKRLWSGEGWTLETDWEGVLLKPFLEQVFPALVKESFLKESSLKGLHLVLWNHHKDFVRLPLSELVEGQALLMTRFQGAPLSAWHGGPLRLMVFDRDSRWGLGALAGLAVLSEATDWISDPETFPETLNSRSFPDLALGRYYAYDKQDWLERTAN